MNQTQYETISEWQNKVFTKATPLSAAHHLHEEVLELIDKLQIGEVDKSEVADCFLLLIGVCNKAGLSYNDIEKLIEDKMQVNLKRSWGEPNEKGYVKHVE